MQASEVSSTGNVVVLKREPSECNYNSSVMLAWQANMDIQYAYACVMYVASYIMKTERAMGVLLKQVATEVRTEEQSSLIMHKLASKQNSPVNMPLSSQMLFHQ